MNRRIDDIASILLLAGGVVLVATAAIDRKDFVSLVRTSRAIRVRIDRAAGERELINRAKERGQRGRGKVRG